LEKNPLFFTLVVLKRVLGDVRVGFNCVMYKWKFVKTEIKFILKVRALKSRAGILCSKIKAARGKEDKWGNDSLK